MTTSRRMIVLTDGYNVLFCDGHVEYWRKNIDPKKLRAMFTRDGGEPVNSP